MNILYFVLVLEIIHYLINLIYYHFYDENKNITVNDHEKVEKIADNINSINEENVNIVYEEIKTHYKDSKIMVKNSILIFPSFLLQKIITTIYFYYTLKHYTKKDFKIKYTANGIFLIRNINKNNELVLINNGIGGFIENCVELVDKIGTKKNVILTIYRCGLFNFYWRRSSMNNYCDEIIELIKDYKNVDMVSHSLGCYVAENILKKNDKRTKNLKLKFNKEILVEPACSPSAGLVFTNSLTLPLYKFVGLLNKFSNNKLYNIFVALIFKTLEMVSIINSLENIDGIRFENRDELKTYVIVGIDDPLANISKHPFKHEIDIIFNNSHILWHDYYHGNFYKYQDMMYKLLNLEKIKIY